MKKATVLAMQTIRERGYRAKLILHVHDEMQLEVPDEEVEPVKAILEQSMELAGEFFNYNIKMEGEAVDGETWYDTH
jgi:DNA polymerase-1